MEEAKRMKARRRMSKITMGACMMRPLRMMRGGRVSSGGVGRHLWAVLDDSQKALCHPAPHQYKDHNSYQSVFRRGERCFGRADINT
eukprot:7994804-Pyramimonas_sp.AAC.1